MDLVVLALAKAYVEETVIGGGALKGKNATVQSITPVAGGNNVVFAWTLDDGTVKTQTLFVKDGADGISPAVDIRRNATDDGIVVAITDKDGIKQSEVKDGKNGTDGTSPTVTMQRNPADDGVIISITDKDGVKQVEIKDGQKGGDGFAPQIVENPDNDADNYKLDITTKDGTTTTPNLKGGKGADGQGVPTGGATGQILVKKSETDFDTEWQTPQAGGGVIVTDATPTQGSPNPLQSGGAFDALAGKQDTLAGTQGQLVGFDAQGSAVPVEAPETGVTEFNTRKGAVVPQQGDYTHDMVGADPAGSAAQALTDAKAYSDEKLVEAKEYTDNAVVGKADKTELNAYTTTDDMNLLLDNKADKTALNGLATETYVQDRINEAALNNGGQQVDLSIYQTKDQIGELTGLATAEKNTIVGAINEVKVSNDNKANQTDLEAHTTDTDIHITADERQKWDGKQDALTGNKGQFVGFDDDGKPITQELPDILDEANKYTDEKVTELSNEAVKYDGSRNVHFEKLVVLDTNQKILGRTPDDNDNHVLLGTLAWGIGTPDEYIQNEVGSSHVHLNLNSKDRPTVELPGGVKEEVAYLNDLGGASLPPGGTTGQVLAKKSEADGDADWVDSGVGGVTVPVTGFVTMGIEDDGILYVYHAEVAPGDPNPYATMFELDENTGNLYYITEVA